MVFCQSELIDQTPRLLFQPRDATEEELRGIHSQKHIDELKDLKACKDYEKMEELFSKYDSVYANEHTFDLALSSAGCTVDLMKEVSLSRIVCIPDSCIPSEKF